MHQKNNCQGLAHEQAAAAFLLCGPSQKTGAAAARADRQCIFRQAGTVIRQGSRRRGKRLAQSDERYQPAVKPDSQEPASEPERMARGSAEAGSTKGQVF